MQGTPETHEQGATMNQTDLLAAADQYLDEQWPAMVDDIAQLCAIPSFAEPDRAAPGAPFGPGPQAALSEALAIAGRLGFATACDEGYIGTADLRGSSDAQLGIIGHVDVVPAGEGWHFQPYDVSLKDGWLVGRGVVDDKGPSVVALHAMRCLADALARAGEPLPYSVRFIVGANEETGMADVAHYRRNNDDPLFLFTPDAEFPVSYGEKGVFQAQLKSAPLGAANIIAIEGGMAVNAVPGQAMARVRTDDGSLPSTDQVKVTWEESGIARLEATGRAAHASDPSQGSNAIAHLVTYLLDHDLPSADERAFLELDQQLLDCTDGSGLGLAASDDDFGALTAVGSTIKLHDGCLVQGIDVRFPTTTTAASLKLALAARLSPVGSSVETLHTMAPYLVEPDTAPIQALLSAYDAATGSHAEPFTMAGATYARQFSAAAGFGPEMPAAERPDWAGIMHGPDEAVSADQLKMAFKAYVLGLYGLEQLTPEQLGANG